MRTALRSPQLKQRSKTVFWEMLLTLRELQTYIVIDRLIFPLGE